MGCSQGCRIEIIGPNFTHLSIAEPEHFAKVRRLKAVSEFKMKDSHHIITATGHFSTHHVGDLKHAEYLSIEIPQRRYTGKGAGHGRVVGLYYKKVVR